MCVCVCVCVCHLAAEIKKCRHICTYTYQHTQIAETGTPGQFILWALVGEDLHQLKLSVPRVFYVNCRSTKELQGEGTAWRRVSRFLPRSAPVFHLSEYCVSEEIFQEHAG